MCSNPFFDYVPEFLGFKGQLFGLRNSGGMGAVVIYLVSFSPTRIESRRQALRCSVLWRPPVLRKWSDGGRAAGHPVPSACDHHLG